MLPQPRIVQGKLPDRNSRKPSSASPNLPLTKIMSPTRAPDLRNAPPCQNVSNHGDINQHLAPRRRIPANQHTPKRGSRPPQPPKNSSSHAPPANPSATPDSTKSIAALHPSPPHHSLPAPGTSSPPNPPECLSRKKCVPSRNQSHVRNNLPPMRRPYQRRVIPHPQRHEFPRPLARRRPVPRRRKPADPLQNSIFATIIPLTQSRTSLLPNQRHITLLRPKTCPIVQ